MSEPGTPEYDAYIKRLVDEAPPLSEDQKNRLAVLLRPAREALTPISKRGKR